MSLKETDMKIDGVYVPADARCDGCGHERREHFGFGHCYQGGGGTPNRSTVCPCFMFKLAPEVTE